MMGAPADNRNLSPTERREEVLNAFELKICILEDWARKGVPDGVEIPRTHAALRRWQGPQGGLGTWSDPTIDRLGTGKYPDLAVRFKNALTDIEKRLARKNGRLPQLKAENTVLKAQNERLTVQNAELIARVDQLQRGLELLQAQADARGKDRS
jgi:hypothetical protein